VKLKDRDRIRQTVMATKDYDGLLGRWSFDKNGDTTLSSISGYTVNHGKFEFTKALEPNSPVPPPPGGKRTMSVASKPSGFNAGVLVEQVLTGLANGSLIAIIALGYTLVYGLIELINFAHGDVFMIGSFTALSCVSALGLESRQPGPALAGGLVLCLLVSMLVCGLLNRLIDKLAYRPLRNAPKLAPLISAIGVSFILMNLGGYWRGWAPVYFPDLLGTHDFNLFGAGSPVTFRVSQLLVMLVALPLLIGIQLFISRTRMGKAMRATAQNPEAAMLMGIDTDKTVAIAFFIGGALAGAAGLLYGVYNHEVRFDLGFRQGLNAFTAAVLGGIGNPRGAVLGGLIIGLVESLTTYYLSQSLAPAMVFAVLIVIIMFRPSGLLGENVPEKV
jgi:branched-chain amino acid transport system permease protein